MGKNKHVDLFKDMIPAVDMGLPELWGAATEDGRKEIKGDLWNLNRYISSVKTNNRELQEHYVLTVNEFYNKNWNEISKHPKLQWMTLCAAGLGKKQFHKWIPQLRERVADLREKATVSEVKEFYKKIYKNIDDDTLNELSVLYTDQQNKKYYFANKFPEMKLQDIEVLSEFVTLNEIEQYEQDSRN